MTSSYIAIDDISFTPSCVASTVAPGRSTTTPVPIVTTPPPCGTTSKFKCKSGACIDVTKRCNFHYDCGLTTDLSDEKDCGTCSFEQKDTHGFPSMCGWRNLGDSRNQWVVTSAKNMLGFNGLLSTRDSTNDANGHYLVIDTSKGMWRKIHLAFLKL